MKCMTCGAAVTRERQVHHYTESGLDNVFLVGIEVEHCPTCGDSPIIPAMGPLHDAIAGALLRKPHRLAGAEIRFLRKLLGWDAKDLAGRVGVTPSQMSRWENDHEVIGPVADRLVRSIYALERQVQDYTSEAFALVDDTAARHDVRLRHARSGGWAEQAAAC